MFKGSPRGPFELFIRISVHSFFLLFLMNLDFHWGWQLFLLQCFSSSWSTAWPIGISSSSSASWNWNTEYFAEPPESWWVSSTSAASELGITKHAPEPPDDLVYLFCFCLEWVLDHYMLLLMVYSGFRGIMAVLYLWSARCRRVQPRRSVTALHFSPCKCLLPPVIPSPCKCSAVVV